MPPRFPLSTPVAYGFPSGSYWQRRHLVGICSLSTLFLSPVNVEASNQTFPSSIFLLQMAYFSPGLYQACFSFRHITQIGGFYLDFSRFEAKEGIQKTQKYPFRGIRGISVGGYRAPGPPSAPPSGLSEPVAWTLQRLNHRFRWGLHKRGLTRDLEHRGIQKGKMKIERRIQIRKLRYGLVVLLSQQVIGDPKMKLNP